MEVLLFISLVLQIALRVYTYVLLARLVLEWVRVFNPNFRPRGFVLIFSDIVYRVTDPPIKFFRKLLPPIRIGQIMLDLGWMITMVACFILIALLP